MGRPKELSEKERQELLAKGYRPVEIWVPDLSDSAVYALAEAEARRIALADQEEDVIDWIEAVQKDMWEGGDRA